MKWRSAAAVAGLGALVLAWCAALLAALWFDLDAAEREALAPLAPMLNARGGLLWLFLLALPLLLWALVRPWLTAWPRAARRLREEVIIVTEAHAAHPVSAGGAREMRELAAAINGLAQAHAVLQSDVQARIAEAGAALEDETRRLAALMSQLTLGVLVCNLEGRVLLYNARAAAMLGAQGAQGDQGRQGDHGATAAARDGGSEGITHGRHHREGAPLGLGRSVSTLLDAAALEHAWQRVRRQLDAGEVAPVAHFVTVRRGDPGARAAERPAPATGPVPAAASEQAALLRVQMVPTTGAGEEPIGYLLLIDDITRSVQEMGRRDATLRHLTEGTRAGLANLRAAAQALRQYPAMAAAQRERFTAAVHEEAERLATQLESALREPADAAAGWPLEELRAADLAFALNRSLRAEPMRDGIGRPLACRLEGEGELHLMADSLALVRLLSHLVRRLAAEFAARDFSLAARPGTHAVRLELGWAGPHLPPGRLSEWEDDGLDCGRPNAPGAADAPLRMPLREVLDRHGAELWAVRAESAQPGRQALCVQLGDGTGAWGNAGSAPAPAASTRGRPIAYDFDLFHQRGQSAVLDDTPLAALVYTVFDTETTGLRPSEGDEIIALGAVRIVNARLLEGECFERRARPSRAVRASAEAVHGISTASLAHEPPLAQVLPAFARFCDGTVLVAHNAAFDMRFLELARASCGVRFEQPVLDTMLLSALVQPGHRSDEHHLEQIAARLGVPVVERHQALGDALTAARVLLKLLPLLAERGIVTLGQARTACEQLAQASERF